MRIQEIPLQQIQRPLIRQTDPQKVEALMASIQEIGQQEPIDVLEVEGQYYGFSGCHRFEHSTAAHSPSMYSWAGLAAGSR